ncbi:ANTAR domain-containing protein [Williamsia sp. R60]
MGTSSELNGVLSERHVIAIAVGMLMQRCRLRRIDATRRLKQVATVSKVSLFDAASILIDTHPRPLRPEYN